jgi:hypothetical protein
MYTEENDRDAETGHFSPYGREEEKRGPELPLERVLKG